MHDPMQTAPAGNRDRRETTSSRAGNEDRSTDQVTIFEAIAEADEGRRLRDDGMRTALHASDIRWKAAAESALSDLAASGVDFTADDLRARVDTLAAPEKALGAIFGAAARRGLIECIGITTSSRPQRHGGLLRVWRGVDVEVGR